MAEYRVTTERAEPVPAAHPGQVTRVERVDTVEGGNPFTGEVHQPHKVADDTEQVYFEGSPQLRGEFGRGVLWVLGGALIIAVPILLGLFARPQVGTLPWWVFAVAAVVGLVVILVPWLRMKTIRYRVTNYRIDFERGLISRTIDTMELWHVEDVKFYQSFWDRLLNVGNIMVISHDDTNPQLLLRSVPNPRALFESLKQRIIAVKRQGGVVKMDTGT